MKYLLIIFLLIRFSASAQNYGDSSITLTVLQKNCYWIGQYVKVSFQWSEREAPTKMKAYVGNGLKPDSVITSVTFKAKYLLGALDALISQPLQVAYTDYRSIVLNSPSIVGYTSLTIQITAKANNVNDPQNNTAIWLRDRYKERTDALDALYNEQKNGVVTWSNQ